MIRKAVDFSLNNRFIVLAIAILLLVWGAISFHNLPVEAYPDVANNYVEIITQWPGISAEQIEQQVTIPLEIAMNGIPDVVNLRSFSLFGLSDLKLVFEDGSENAWNRERVLERLAQVTLPPNVNPQMGTDWSPVGQIYFFTLRSTNPKYDVMELKSLEDWVIEKNFKSVPNVVDVASFGGPTREYQVRIDPEKLKRAFIIMLQQARPEKREVVRERVSLLAQMDYISRKVKDQGTVSFFALCRELGMTREVIIVTFLAILELVRRHRIEFEQADIEDDIRLFPISHSVAQG